MMCGEIMIILFQDNYPQLLVLIYFYQFYVFGMLVVVWLLNNYILHTLSTTISNKQQELLHFCYFMHFLFLSVYCFSTSLCCALYQLLTSKLLRHDSFTIQNQVLEFNLYSFGSVKPIRIQYSGALILAVKPQQVVSSKYKLSDCCHCVLDSSISVDTSISLLQCLRRLLALLW